MNAFLESFDRAINEALETGEPGLLVERPNGPQRIQFEGDLLVAFFFPVRARTMHPAFMAAKPRKYDPERDNG